MYYAEKEGIEEKEGHPDFEYSRRKFRELDIEERRRNELIKQALDRMNHYYAEVEIPEKPVDVELARKKRVEMLLQEEKEIEKEQQLEKRKEESKKVKIEIVDEGDFHYNRTETTVPEEVYADRKYRKRIEIAKTVNEIESIVSEYYNQHPLK